MDMPKSGRGSKSTAEWRKVAEGEWARVRRLRKADGAALARAGHSAQVWAGRYDFRAQYRIRAGGTELWVRIFRKDAPCDVCGGAWPCTQHRWDASRG